MGAVSSPCFLLVCEGERSLLRSHLSLELFLYLSSRRGGRARPLLHDRGRGHDLRREGARRQQRKKKGKTKRRKRTERPMLRRGTVCDVKEKGEQSRQLRRRRARRRAPRGAVQSSRGAPRRSPRRRRERAAYGERRRQRRELFFSSSFFVFCSPTKNLHKARKKQKLNLAAASF